MGPEADDIFHSFTLSEDEKGDYDVASSTHISSNGQILYMREPCSIEGSKRRAKQSMSL